jgi:WD40-like Beta Propeller Repeat
VSVRRALARFRAPDEVEAEERAWVVVRSAYQERVPSARRTSYRRPALAVVAVVIAGGLALSPAGATVGRLITRALGVQHAAPALFSLPAPGRMLVSGPGGTWSVAADGSTRRLGAWTEASWSPHGLYVTVAGEDQLAAVDARGTPQWALARPAVRDPRWYPPTGYRVAYLSSDQLRVVAGDGTGDHLLATPVANVAPTWRPAHPYQVAYVTRAGRVVVRDADTGRTLWSAKPETAIRQLAWSADGQRLLALSPTAVRVYTGHGAPHSSLALPPGTSAIDGALSPSGHTLALVLGGAASDVVEQLDLRHPAPRRVLAGAGLRQVAWSPDGKWLLVTWPAADQWVFIRVSGAPRITAVSRIAQQFSTRASRGFPQLDGWCCTAEGAAT